MTLKEKHIKLWHSIIIFLGDNIDNLNEFEDFDDLKECVWRKTFNKNIEPYCFCYACEEGIARLEEGFNRCKNCPIAEKCGTCLASNSVYDNLYNLFDKFVFGYGDLADIEQVIEYCKQIRDGWKE